MSMQFLDYDLPLHLIAQEPIAPRDHSRLLTIRRTDQTLEHHIFHELPDLLNPGDLLVLNDTRVLAARLLGRRVRTGGKWEGIFLREAEEGLWEILCQTRGRLVEHEIIDVEPGPFQLELVRKTFEGHWLVRPGRTGAPRELLAAHGQVPLPPYIRKGRAGPGDEERYQTIFAREAGAVAAPTAGLHFTAQLFERLKERGIDLTYVTLHVGPGTFRPIKVDDFREHKMHREWGQIGTAAVAAITRCRALGNRIVAVGTTSVRVLETMALSGPMRPWAGETDLFIYPPHQFKAVDALITNFHLPRSTLLLLVGAFAGDSLLRQAYMAAIENSYRFYSYGDAMLIG